MAIELIEWKQPGFNFDPDANSLENGYVSDEPSMTIKSLGPASDVNAIVKQYGITGELPVRRNLGEYGVFDESLDFREMVERVQHGDRVFAALPAAVRERFGGDPASFFEWMSVPENHDEATKMGLLVPPAGSRIGVDVAPSVPSAEVAAEQLAASKESLSSTVPNGS